MRINIDALAHICNLPVAGFHRFGTPVRTPEGVYLFRDNHAPLLAVAHLDTVLSPARLRHHRGMVWHPCLDDRLGVYLLLHILPALGIRYDLLLTEGEEEGRSTARYFRTRRRYRWMFSFDRAGTDVVMYQYQNRRCARLLRRRGLSLGLGSYSDICFLAHLGCKGFNFGTGYYNNHSPHAHANLAHTCCMVRRFLDFHAAYGRLRLPHPDICWDPPYITHAPAGVQNLFGTFRRRGHQGSPVPPGAPSLLGTLPRPPVPG